MPGRLLDTQTTWKRWWSIFFYCLATDLAWNCDHCFSVSAFVAPIRQTLPSSCSFNPSINRSSPNLGLRESILDRFTNPRIEDPMLPLTEAALTQIVAPMLQLFWLRLNQSTFPSWATPLGDYTFAPRGALLAPTLVHGAALACAWLLGCLAARAFEKKAYEGGVGQVLKSTLRAGAFACGILILATQLDIYKDMGGYVQIGDSPETDLRIYRALVELSDDVFFEAVTLLVWRVLRSRATSVGY